MKTAFQKTSNMEPQSFSKTRQLLMQAPSTILSPPLTKLVMYLMHLGKLKPLIIKLNNLRLPKSQLQIKRKPSKLHR